MICKDLVHVELIECIRSLQILNRSYIYKIKKQDKQIKKLTKRLLAKQRR